MLKLLLRPDEQSYTVDEASVALQTDVKGGPNRYRRDVLNQTIKVTVQFTVNPEEYQYLRSFYNVVNKGVDPFMIDLLVETSELRTHIANIVPGTWRLSKVVGFSFTVRFTLDVQPNDEGIDYASVVAGFEPFDYVPPGPLQDFGGE